jgi:hypothetical protein
LRRCAGAIRVIRADCSNARKRKEAAVTSTDATTTPASVPTAANFSPAVLRSAERVRAAAGWCYREFAAGHHAVVGAPRETAEVFLEVAALL